MIPKNIASVAGMQYHQRAMGMFDSLIDCLLGTVYSCVQVEPGLSGTRTSSGLPASTSPVATVPITLPQDADCLSGAIREVSRATSRCVYTYQDVPGFDMPMANTCSAYLSGQLSRLLGKR